MKLHHDLHSHSTASDGTLTPEELVEEALDGGVDVLALTDHDTTAGIGDAARAADGQDIRLIPGVEISVSWNAYTIHVLGLNIDIRDEQLQRGLQGLREFREWRAQEIARRLEKAGIQGALTGARAHARGSIVGRTHFARFLVEQGYARSLREVFKRYLVKKQPGYVPGEWATLEQAVTWIRGAGGLAVIAHPARYRLSATRLRALLEEFKSCGGLGLEVVSGSHSRDDITAMSSVARRLELLASCGSDYHGPENPWVRLGRLANVPDGCRPVWESTQWRAATAR